MGKGIGMDFTTLKIPTGNILAYLIKIDTLFIDTLCYRLCNNFGLYAMSVAESYSQKVNFCRVCTDVQLCAKIFIIMQLKRPENVR